MLAVWWTCHGADRVLERRATDAKVPALWCNAAPIVRACDPDGKTQSAVDAHLGSQLGQRPYNA